MVLQLEGCIICVTEFISISLSHDPLVIKVEPIPSTAGGAVGHLGSSSHAHTEWITFSHAASLQTPLSVLVHVVHLVVHPPHLVHHHHHHHHGQH